MSDKILEGVKGNIALRESDAGSLSGVQNIGNSSEIGLLRGLSGLVTHNNNLLFIFLEEEKTSLPDFYIYYKINF
jgi:hypothetical protein